MFVNVLALAPEITVPPASQLRTVDGSTVTLDCRTFGAPKPIVKWFHGTDELTGNRYTVMKDGSLEIRSGPYHIFFFFPFSYFPFSFCPLPWAF